MKRRLLILVMILVLIVLGSFPLAGEELRVTIRADWMFTLRGGIEWRFSRYAGLAASIGTNIQMLVSDVCGVLYLLPEESPWQVNLLLGMPTASVPLSFNAGMVTLGGAIAVEYRFQNDVGIQLRLGEGFPLFFEEGREITRDLDFPFNLWPEVAIGVTFRTRGRDRL